MKDFAAGQNEGPGSVDQALAELAVDGFDGGSATLVETKEGGRAVDGNPAILWAAGAGVRRESRASAIAGGWALPVNVPKQRFGSQLVHG